jgi:hypothetical protein
MLCFGEGQQYVKLRQRQDLPPWDELFTFCSRVETTVFYDAGVKTPKKKTEPSVFVQDRVDPEGGSDQGIADSDLRNLVLEVINSLQGNTEDALNKPTEPSVLVQDRVDPRGGSMRDIANSDLLDLVLEVINSLKGTTEDAPATQPKTSLVQQARPALGIKWLDEARGSGTCLVQTRGQARASGSSPSASSSSSVGDLFRLRRGVPSEC